jgi:hypothetical protein
MPKILFVFAGTGDTSKRLANTYELGDFSEDVIRVYFNGCQDKKVGGSYVFGQLSPNLDTAGKNVRACFNQEGQLSLDSLKKQFGSAIVIHPPGASGAVSVENINLIGFSRGAVTTFCAARHLDDLGKPIRIFAQDPVPGNTLSGAKKKDSEFYKNYDLTGYKNIKRAEVIIGGYSNDVNMVHDIFFRQMAPLFPAECDSHIYVTPKKHHLKASGASANQRSRFLKTSGCSDSPSIVAQGWDDPFFIPKVSSQKHHQHNAMRMELIPSYRERLCSHLMLTYKNPKQYNDQTLQALFALKQCSMASVEKKTLEKSIIDDHTAKGEVIRDFVIEFENIVQHALRTSPQTRDSSDLNKFRESVYKQLNSFPLSVKLEDKKHFIKAMSENLNQIKSAMPAKEYKELKKLSELFLENNTLLSSDFSALLHSQKDSEPIAPLPAETTTAELFASQRDFKKTLQAMTSEVTDDEDLYREVVFHEDPHSEVVFHEDPLDEGAASKMKRG